MLTASEAANLQPKETFAQEVDRIEKQIRLMTEAGYNFTYTRRPLSDGLIDAHKDGGYAIGNSLISDEHIIRW